MNHRQLTQLLNDTMHRTLTNSHLLTSALTNLRNSQAGYPSGSNGGTGAHLNDDGTPPGLDRHLNDPVTKDRQHIDTLIERMHADSIRLNVLLTEWTTITDTQTDTTGSDCEACGAHIVKPERLRAGLCNACRMHFRRWCETNSGDRHEWMWQRRAATAVGGHDGHTKNP
jgi:hypothetical protein